MSLAWLDRGMVWAWGRKREWYGDPWSKWLRFRSPPHKREL